MVTDPIADFLTRIRNAQMANHRIVEIPASNLKKRMQGKSCFNFRTLDEALFAELSGLTKAGVEKYRAKNWL